MKKGLLLAFGLLLVGGTIVGCGANKATQDKKDSTATEKEGQGKSNEDVGEKDEVEEKDKIGIILSGDSMEAFSPEIKTIKENLNNEGIVPIIEYSDNNQQKQIDNINNLYKKDVKEFLIEPVNPNGLSEVLKRAKEDGIPVMSYKKLIMNSDAINYYVTFDGREIGRDTAKALLKLKDIPKTNEDKEKEINVQILIGKYDSRNEFFYNGIIEIFKEYIDGGAIKLYNGNEDFSKMILPQDSTEEAKNQVLEAEKILGKLPDIIITSNDNLAKGAVEASNERLKVKEGDEPKDWPLITTIGASKEILDQIEGGSLALTAAMDPNQMAVDASKILIDQLKKGDAEINDYQTYDNGKKIVGTYCSNVYIVRKDNLEKYLNRDKEKEDKKEEKK